MKRTLNPFNIITANESRACSEQCLNGCWGEGDSKCVDCLNYKDGSHCVAECPENKYLEFNYFKAKWTCVENCSTSFYPHFELKMCLICPENQHAEVDEFRLEVTCVESCSWGFYPAMGGFLCLPCDRQCVEC